MNSSEKANFLYDTVMAGRQKASSIEIFKAIDDCKKIVTMFMGSTMGTTNEVYVPEGHGTQILEELDKILNARYIFKHEEPEGVIPNVHVYSVINGMVRYRFHVNFPETEHLEPMQSAIFSVEKR